MRERLLGPIDAVAALDDLRCRQINYDPSRAPLDGRPDGHWHVDSGDAAIGHEPPGPPLPGGVWESACLLVLRYEFTDPKMLRAVYRRDDELLGRDMLLEGRFFGLRFYLGVRVTRVIDENRGSGAGAQQVWGWSYQTLQGHLEQGRLNYEVIKNLASGQVVFRVSGYSRRAPVPDPVIRWGFRLFGRWTQQRFYRAIQARLHRLVQAAQRGEPPPVPTVRADGLAIAPSGTTPHPLERFARSSHHPGS
ncbi:MAG: DUF1990 domain-containing protein [Pseudonocardiales bacterium]|nr:DUF1990 family protein [Pseudonocardiales bacterium]PZS26952.1 MAG: DUF1990 domain-containing protein [Pseudonocardiales bacterium]